MGFYYNGEVFNCIEDVMAYIEESNEKLFNREDFYNSWDHIGREALLKLDKFGKGMTNQDLKPFFMSVHAAVFRELQHLKNQVESK